MNQMPRPGSWTLKSIRPVISRVIGEPKFKFLDSRGIVGVYDEAPVEVIINAVLKEQIIVIGKGCPVEPAGNGDCRHST
jgi:hypothetical protein